MYKIAILDDDNLWYLSIQRFLRNEFVVDTFSDADSLLQEIVENIYRYDLIMIDLSLPAAQYQEVDGRKLIRYLRETLPNPHLLVLVTGWIGKNEMESSNIICPEADAFLAKDAGLDEISQRLKEILNSKSDTKFG